MRDAFFFVFFGGRGIKSCRLVSSTRRNYPQYRLDTILCLGHAVVHQAALSVNLTGPSFVLRDS